MSIRTKLTFFVLLVVIAFIGAGTSYYFVTIPENQMGEEQQVLKDLSKTILVFETNLNKIDSLGLESQQQVIVEKKKRLDEAYKKLADLEVLPSVSSEISSALVIILNLQVQVQNKWNSYVDKVTKVIDYSEEVFPVQYSEKSLTLLDFFSVQEVRNHPKSELAFAAIEDLGDELYTMDLNLDSAVRVIEQQSQTIRSEIDKIRSKAYIILFTISAGVILLAIIAALLFANKIAKNIKNIEQAISKMSKGDLTVRPQIKSKDELGALSENLVQFTENLSSSIHTIKHSSTESVQVKEELLKATDHTSAMVSEIHKSSESISEGSDHLETQIDTSTKQVHNAADYVRLVEEKLQEQSSMVEESTSAVTEMIASINSVTDIAAKKKQATENLVSSSKNGGEKLASTLAVVQDINENIDVVMDTVNIIQNVTAQTNLLAMNAAIEAAHAGDAGRGFAVVAEEIRKLAETTSVSSKKIAGVVKEVVSKIGTASESGIETKAAFEVIDTEVKGVSESLEEIATNMVELQTGGSQVLEAMNKLQEVSLDIKENSNDMAQSSQQTLESMDSIKNVASTVRESIGHIKGGVGGIGNAVEQTQVLAKRISKVTEDLDGESSRFQTEIDTKLDETGSYEENSTVGEAEISDSTSNSQSEDGKPDASADDCN